MAALALGVAGSSLAAQPALAGRWDLTLTSKGGPFPSWLEVVVQGDSLSGRFQGQFGHATPIAAVRLDGSRFRFVWPDEGKPDAKPTEVEGIVTDAGRLEGVMVAHWGERFPFTGVVAPRLDRMAPNAWGPPASLLVDGLAGWRPRDPKVRNGWSVSAGVLTNTPPSSDLISIRTFTDFRLRFEVNVPVGGNSGVYLRGRHEVQIQDDAGKAPGSRTMGAIYGQVTPTALPALPAGKWQALEITLVGRRVTVVLNGETIVDRAEIPGITGGALDSDEAASGPIMLQGDHSGVQYRNLTIQLPASAALDPALAAVETAERARFVAQVRRDTAALRDLLGAELTYIHSNALIETKAHFIETVGSGRIVYQEITPIEMTHRVYGQTALGRGKVRVGGTLNGQAFGVDLLFTTVLVERDGRWQLVAWQSTRAQ